MKYIQISPTYKHWLPYVASVAWASHMPNQKCRWTCHLKTAAWWIVQPHGQQCSSSYNYQTISPDIILQNPNPHTFTFSLLLDLMHISMESHHSPKQLVSCNLYRPSLVNQHTLISCVDASESLSKISISVKLLQMVVESNSNR